MTVLHRLVESGGAYPPRPTVSVDFLGATDPGSLLLPGDTWTQLPAATQTVPNAPTIGTATAGNASASVAFTPAGSGPAATSYTATSTPGGLTGSGTASPITVSGLTNGTAYTFKVKATNSAGSSPESGASNSVTPTGGGSGTALTDDFTGANGAAWSAAVWSAAPGGIFTTDIQNNQGRVLFTSVGSYEEFTRRFAPANSANWRIRWCLVTPPATAGWSNTVFFQATSWAAGVNTPATAYVLLTTTNGYQIQKRTDGTVTDLVPFTALGATNRWLDIKVVNGALSYKAWTGALGDAPASYTTVSAPTPLTGAGAAGMYFAAGPTAGSMDFRIDDVLVDNNPT